MNADQAEVVLNNGFQLQLDHVRGVRFTFVLVKSALTYSNASYLSCSLVTLENPSVSSLCLVLGNERDGVSVTRLIRYDLLWGSRSNIRTACRTCQ